jgi:hypothetical protein
VGRYEEYLEEWLKNKRIVYLGMDGLKEGILAVGWLMVNFIFIWVFVFRGNIVSILVFLRI